MRKRQLRILTTHAVPAKEQSVDERFSTFSAVMCDYLVKESSVLLYVQLSRILRRFIERGAFCEGDQFPTEDTIAVNFDVSRQTANRAVQELIRQGLLKRERGRGTFIRRSHPVDLTLLTNNLSLTEQFPPEAVLRTDMISRRVLPKEPLVSEILGLSPDAPILHIRRLRWVDDRPTIVCDSFLSAEEFSELGQTPLLGDSLYSTLRKHYGLSITRSERRVEADEIFEAEVAELLEVEIYGPILLLSGVTYVDSPSGERPIEVMNGYVRERVGFRSTIRASDVHLPPTPPQAAKD